MKKILINISIILFSVILYSQELPKITSTPPQVASLGKYLEIPVGLSTGIPDISIPLINIKGSSISIPISLSYHSSGIRVNEIASRNGLGWNLNAGGIITRNVRGIPDDNKDGYINTLHTVAEYESADLEKKTDLYLRAVENDYDYESDIYYFNFLGQSGKFFFNQNNGEIIFHQKSDLKINFTKDSTKKIVGWRVKTTNGITYEFGFNENAIKKETDTPYIKGLNLPPFNPASLFNYTSGWYLTKIIDFLGNETLYTYQKELNNTITYWNISSHSKEFNAAFAMPGGSIGETLMFSKKQYAPIFLTEIKSAFGKIAFEYLKSRLDLINDSALTDIKLYSTNNNLIDSYKFEYDYFNSLDVNQHEYFGIDNQLKKRLYLRKVVQEISHQKNKEYLLSYNTNHILPNRFSYAQDFWGYYNGRLNNVLYPEIEVIKFTNIIKRNGANRKVYPDFVKACILKSITYPTKGKTEFFYESNTIGSVSGEKAFYIGNQYQNLTIPGGQLGNQIGWSEVGKTYTSNFSITNTFPFAGIVDYSISTDVNCNYAANDCPTIKITKSDGTIVSTFNTSNGQGTIYLPNGNYILKIQNGILQTGKYVYITLRGRKLLPEEENALTGGLRIKEILFKDTNDSILKKQNYNYNLFNNLNKSSGYSLAPPIYYYKKIPHAYPCVVCFTDRIVSNPIFPLNGQSSSNVTYTNITQNFSNNGKIESKFSYSPDPEFNSSNIIGLNDGTAYPLVPSLDYSHRRGLLINEKVYNELNQIKQETFFNYSSNGEFNYSSVNYKVGRIGDYEGIHKYNNLSERFYLKEKVKKIYFKNSSIQNNDSIIQNKEVYTYDNGYLGRTFPKETETTNSLGKVLKTVTEYAHEKNDIRLINENRISIPIKTETYKKVGETKTKLSEQNTVYSTFSNSLYLPKIIQTSKADADPKDRITYHNYDNKGNPTELSKANATHIVYLWGYNKTQPIAKIENATFEQVTSAITTLPSAYNTLEKIQELSNVDSDRKVDVIKADGSITKVGKEGDLREALRALRNHDNLSETQITSYTYDPLIGVTSITDPRGNVMYYHYDEFNRLQFVKDKDGYILSQNEYYYKK